MIRLYRNDNPKLYRDFPDYTFSRYNYAVFDFIANVVLIEGVQYALPPEIISAAVKATVTASSNASLLDDAFTVTEELESGITYQGWALAGCSGTNEAKFCIKKIFLVGEQTFEVWAEGNKNFDKSWDNRAVYPYPFQIT